MRPPSPSGATLATQTGGEKPESHAHLSVEILTREARKVMADLDVSLSPARLSRLLRKYIRQGRSDIDFRTWFISYADPTGETAVRNVSRGGGGPDA